MRNQRHWTPPDYAVRCSISAAQTPHPGECTATGKTATLTFGTDLALRIRLGLKKTLNPQASELGDAPDDSMSTVRSSTSVRRGRFWTASVQARRYSGCRLRYSLAIIGLRQVRNRIVGCELRLVRHRLSSLVWLWIPDIWKIEGAGVGGTSSLPSGSEEHRHRKISSPPRITAERR